MMRRAYSLLQVEKMVQEGEYHVIKGVATTPTPDRMNDIVDPMGATFAETIPLLWQHDSAKPVGHTQFSKPTKSGIPFTSWLPIIKEAGALKERVDEAIHSLQYRLVGAVSIGFRVLNDAFERIENGGLKFLEIEIMELSLVTIPANTEATITSIKSLDQRALAASGRKSIGPVKLIQPPASREKPAHRGSVILIPR